MNILKKHPLILGTVLLTGANLLCRFVGFFYRIYLSRTFGGEQMGIYQLTGPVIGITMSITCGIFQTVISKLSAEEKEDSKQILRIGLSLALPVSLLFTILLYYGAPFLATFWLKEARCEPLIRLFSLCVLPACIHNCLTGYFLGRKKVALPAIIQVVEQFVRTGAVILFITHTLQEKETISLTIVIWGNLLGEISSMIFSVIAVSLLPDCNRDRKPTHLYHSFLSLLYPLLGTRIAVNILQATETILLPYYLKLHSGNDSEALTIYGTLTGMALPLILFPTTLTGSLATVLLPNIAALRAEGNIIKARKTFHATTMFCAFLGTFAGLFFFLFATPLGHILFDSTLSSLFIKTLAPLCPFLYMSSALNGTLQGIGKMNALFIIQVFCLSLRLLLLYLLLPRFGIIGYLYILLAAGVTQCFLSFRVIAKNI